MKIYVGNLPFSFDDDALAKLFAEHGEINSSKVILDRDTGRSRGFGFVEMTDDSQAQKAIEATNGFEVDGRRLTVNQARPQKRRSERGGQRGGRNSGW